MAIQSIIKGAVKIRGIPESACFTTFIELLKSLEEFLEIEISNQSFSNIVISNEQPGSADRNKLWLRLSNSGVPVGFLLYRNNQWIQIFPAPTQVYWLYGDSSTPPAGYKLLELSDNILVGADYTQMIALAVPNGGVPPYVYYPAIYIGL